MARGGKRRGTGRPKRSGKHGEPTKTIRVPTRLVDKIAELIPDLLNELSEEEPQTETVPLPVKPRNERLPLDSLPWDAFEAFCRDFISRYLKVKECYHYGIRGNRQLGIDLIADLEGGEKWAFQCKQWQKFTFGNAQRAIEETTYPADRYILLLSREASAAVRSVIDAHPKWDVWDARDISQKVRELPIDVARRLVEDHFGAEWRNAFLGLSGLTAFVTPEDFFQEWLNPTKPFNHTWQLVGRDDYLERLHKFVKLDQKQERVAILPGRGGIGKTKLLYEFAKEFDNHHSSFTLRFAAEGVPITAESLDSLPVGKPCVIVMDDAHRREDLSVLLAYLRQHSHKLVLLSRPHAIEYLQVLLRQAGFDSREITRLEELRELSREDMKTLARQALGNEYAHFADQLAAVSRDCPLVTVVGGRLLAKRAIPLRLLERDEDFRHDVLTRFHDGLVGSIGHRIEPNLREEILGLIAAIGPIRLTEEQFERTAAEFLDIERSKLVSSINILEQSGVLLRRGYTLRITPDVLSDHILHKASLTSQGEPTGYAQRVFKEFWPVYPTQVFRNLAELDWRVRHTSTQETDLLANIWQTIWEEFRAVSHSGRCELLELLQEVAYYQPGRTLELVEFAMRHPATVPESGSLSSFYTHAKVLHILPRLLEQISYTLDYLPRCCDLLLELARNDRRELNPYPEHPMRVLTELAKYNSYKPLEFNQMVLEAVARWLKKPDTHNHIYFPLDVLDPLLAKTAYSTHNDGLTINFYPFVVSREKTLLLREQALRLIEECVTSDQLIVSFRAVKSLEEALREPVELFNQKISAQEREQWIPEQLEIIEFLHQLITRSASPVIQLKIIEALDWHACRSSSHVVKQKAAEVIASIPDSPELRLFQVLSLSHKRVLLPEDGEDFYAAHQKREQRMKEACRSAAEEFLQQYPEPSEGVQVLNESLQAIASSSALPKPWLFLQELSEAEPNYDAGMCEAIVEVPDCPLAPHLSSLLYKVRGKDLNRAIAIAQRAVDTGVPTLCGSLAQGCWAWADNLQLEDVDLIKKLLAHDHVEVRRPAIDSLGMMRQRQPQLATAMALTVDIGSSTELASELCQVFDAEYGIPPSTLSDEELGALLTKLEPVANIEEYHISKFLAYISKRLPCAVVQLLLKRIERDEEDRDRSYQPLPYFGFQHKLDGLAESDEYEDIMRDIRNQALKPSYNRRFWLPKLFKEASLDFTPVSLNVLNEWINSGESEKVQAVSCLLRDAPQSFVFSHVEFVNNLLEQAHAKGDECYQFVSSELLNSAIAGVRGGTPWQPFPEDVALRDESSAVTAQFFAGSPAHKFYNSLARHAKASIQEELMCDQDL